MIASAVSVAGAGSVGEQVAPAAHRLRGFGRREGELDDEGMAGDRVQAERELGHDAEVAAAAAQPPVQVGVLVGGGADGLAVGGDERVGLDVVAGQPGLAGEPAHAAAERQAADAGVRDVAGGRRQPVRLRRPVEVAQQRAALHPGAASRPDRRVTADIGVRSIISPPSGTEWPSDVVPAALHADLESRAARMADGGGDVAVAARSAR